MLYIVCYSYRTTKKLRLLLTCVPMCNAQSIEQHTICAAYDSARECVWSLALVGEFKR